MADSVDRVFVHALNTVKKIPRTGAARPPPADRLRLYGLYKQAMEGDVDGVMERPGGSRSRYNESDELRKEREKWDAWNAQKGLSKTEAKRKYIEALIETMRSYASSTEAARQLVEELVFVWDQIKNNSPSSSNSSPQRHGRQIQQPLSGSEGPMRVLSPMSQDDEAERESRHQMGYEDEDENEEDDEYDEDKARERKATTESKWKQKLELALTKMTAEVAALREHITTGREYQGRKQRSWKAWIGWLIWNILKHLLLDAVVLAIVLLYFRKRKDRRLEDLVRSMLKLGREYVRKILPPR